MRTSSSNSFIGLILLLMGVVGLLTLSPQGVWRALAQQPTGSVPTVTGTPIGCLVKVALLTNVPVYAGPATGLYPIIGYLVPGQIVPAIGRNADSSWLKIVYYGVPGNEGWVYALYTTLVEGGLPPVIATPPFPTPRQTPTLSEALATLAAASSTPLPTFTLPPPISIPTFADGTNSSTRIPQGLVILVLATIGLFGAIVSLLRRQ